jgi:VWFA-related protein
MARRLCFFAALVCLTARIGAAQGDVVFRSDVSLVRVDAQVVDREQRTITGLNAEDFVLRENGQPQEIRNFAREDMPVDILLLLDVSGSMRPHVERIASAAREAMMVLGRQDRIGVMVFDRVTRLRLPFRANRQEVEGALEALLRQETFNGGTDITRALFDAAAYVAREGRRDARRAIVILTDDQTERGRDEAGVSRALANADAVLSALLAPDAMRHRSGTPGGSYPGQWPGSSLPDIIFGRRRPPYGGRGGPVITGSRTQSAGTAEIARRSGGDSLRVDDASALETTLSRIRQRYALHFYLPEGVKPGQEREIEVELSAAARRRYPDAEVRYRRTYQTSGGTGETVAAAPEPEVVAQSPEPRRRPAVSEPTGPRGPSASSAEPRGGWRRAGEPEPEPAATQQSPNTQKSKEDEPQPRRGGWRRVKPGEEP